MRLSMALFLSLIVVASGYPDTVLLKDGTRLRGTIRSDTTGSVVFETREERTLRNSEVAFLDRTCTLSEAFPLVPVPQKLELTDDDFSLTAPMLLSCDRPTTTSQFALGLLREGLKAAGAITDSPDASARRIVLREEEPALLAAHGDEAYRLEVTSSALHITGAGARGAFYGVQTALQLIKGNSRFGAAIRGCRIEDWPATPIRICNLPRLTHKSDLRLFRRYVAFLARFKFNTLILENSGAIKLDRHPEAWWSDGFTKAEIRDLLDDFRRYNFEVIPLFNSFGHVNEWLGTEPGELENYDLRPLFSDPEIRDTLAIANPRARELLFDCYDELLALFGTPRFFHAGMDEASRRGFARYAKQLGQESSDLFASHVDAAGTWFDRRGVRMMMWADLLLDADKFPGIDCCNGGSPTFFARALDKIRVKPVMMDWHYDADDCYASAAYLKGRGYDVMVVPWKRPINTYFHGQTAGKLGLTGICATMWNFLDRGGNPLAEPDIMAAPILVSLYGWNPRTPRPAELGWNPEDLFAREWNKSE
jgi:hypothetical protein